MKHLVVLLSGNGSNLQAIIDAIESDVLKDTQISCVISNRKDAYGLQRANKHSIQSIYFPLKPFIDSGKTRDDFDLELAHKGILA